MQKILPAIKHHFVSSGISPYDIILHAGSLRCSATRRKLHLSAAKWDRKCKVDLGIAVLSPSECIFHVYKPDLVHVVLKVILLAE